MAGCEMRCNITDTNLLRQVFTTLLFVAVVARTAVGVDPVQALFGSGDRSYDISQDWTKDVMSKGKGGCHFAKKGTFRPPPSCPPPRTPVNRTVASQLGWRWAPILYQHPLDTSFLTDPARWMAEATKYERLTWKALPNYSLVRPADNQDGVARYDFIAGQQYIATRLVEPRDGGLRVPDGPTLARKAVVDPVVNGRLTGKVYYTAFRPYDDATGEAYPHAWVYTYHLYYPWNGGSSQALATQVGNRKQGVEYEMYPDGIHEGDLEHIKVWVCEDDMLNDDPSTAVRRAQYSQHGWLPDYDCTAGECNWETDEAGARRLVSYAGLGSHANYPWETPLFVYLKVRVEALINMDGLYIADRHKRGAVFYPTQDNVLFLPFASEMTPQQQQGNLSWAMFPGVWGGTITGVDKQRVLTCLYGNHTVYGPCNVSNPAYWVLDLVLRPVGWSWTDMEYTAEAFGNTVTGPLWDRVFSFNWELEREAPLHTKSLGVGGFAVTLNDGLCPLEAELQHQDEPPSYFHRITLKDYLGALVGILLTSFVITFAMILPVLLCRGDEPYTYYDAGAETTEEDMRRAYEAAKVASYDTALTSYSTADTAGGKGQAGQAGNGKVAGAALGEGVEREGDEGGSGDGATGPGADLEAGQQVGEAQGLVPGVRAPGTALTEGSGSSLADGGGVGVQLAPAGAGAGAGLACSGQGAGTRGESSLKRRREDKDQPPQQQELGGHGVGEQGVGERDAAQLLRAGALAGIRSSQAAVVEAFGSSALQPYLLAVWVFVGVSLFIAGVVLCVLGVVDSRAALDRVLPLPLWATLTDAVTAVLVVFGVVHLGVIATSLCMRPTCGMLCGTSGAPGRPPRAPRLEALRQSWRAHAVLVGLMAIEVGVSMLVFAFGLMMWLARYGVSEACVAALGIVFRTAEFLKDVCIDLNVVGIETQLCGGALKGLCSLWADLNVDFLSYGAMLFVIAQLMFMVLATTNYVTQRTTFVARQAIALAEKRAAGKA